MKFNTQYPITIDLDWQNNSGIIYELNLHNNKVLTHIHIYLYVKYGISIKIQEEDNTVKHIIFNKNEIIINFTEEDIYLTNVLFTINYNETFEAFLEVFKDNFFYLKHAHKLIHNYDKDENLFGIEIELVMNEMCDYPFKRKKLLDSLKERYGKQIYTCTEDLRNHFIEINNYPMNLDNFYRLYYVLEFLINNGMDFNDSSNIHIHVSKNQLGRNLQETKENINKLLVYFYNIDDYIYREMSTDLIDNWRVCPTIKYLIDNYLTSFCFEKVLDDLLAKSNEINKKERPPRLNYYRLINEYDEEKTFEFRLSTILNADKETFFKLICFVEYCVKVVINKSLNEVKDLTIEDFLNYWNNKKDYLYKITDF